MKKSLIALMAMAAMSMAAAQTTVGVEYDFHKTKGLNRNSNYWATGITQTTKYGIVDGWVQGAINYDSGQRDNVHGWEVGYSYSFPVTSSLSITPRLATGHMDNIDVGGGAVANAHYLLGTVEADYQLRDGLSAFANASHTRGLNADAIRSWNRVTAGVDYSLSKSVSVRLGVSHIRQLQLDQNGLYTIVSYTLGQ